MNPRVLLAGLFHETHTFLAERTTLADFAVRRGDQLLQAAGDASPLAGVVETARQAGWTLRPTIDLRAMPSGLVDDQVVELFWTELATGISAALPDGLEGIFLVLHGAMASQSYPDVEGELLQRVAALLGSHAGRIPVGGVLDLHANFSPRMARYSQALVAYRENPHTDAHASAVRAAWLLDRVMRSGRPTHTLYSQPAVVWAPTGVATAAEPMKSLEAMARQLEQENPALLAVNVLAGYSFADTHDTGVSFSAVVQGPAAEAQAHLDQLADWAWRHRHQGVVRDLPLAEAISRAQQHAEGPVLLVEPSDNIGGGAPGDGTVLLAALVEHQLPRSAIIVNDPAAAASLARVEPGQRRKLAIGGRGCPWACGPVELEVELVSTSNGRFVLNDPHSHLASMYGLEIDMGPTAVVRHGPITLLLTSRKTPPFDLGQWTSQGLDPTQFQTIVVKAAVAHGRAYNPIARASYWVETPGPCTSNLESLPYQRLRRPVFPLDDA